MAKIRVLGILTVLVTFLGAASMAHAGIIAYEVPAGTAGNQAYGGSLGMDFDVNWPITIYALGVFDSGSDGLSRTITAQLYNRTTQTLVPGIEITFSPGDPGALEGGSRFKPLGTPVKLPVGYEGTIVASGYGATELNGNIAVLNWTTNSGGGVLSFVGGGRFGAANAFPTIVDGGPENRYAAGTFRYDPVPEPGTMLLIGSGLVGIGVGARRRGRRK